MANQAISFADVENLVIKQAKFNPFQLIDVILNGDIQKAIKMLDSLATRRCCDWAT